MSSSDAPLPEYRERSIGYERYATSLPGPYTQVDASMAGYVFKADGYCLQGVINHYLGTDGECHHFALPMVVLTLVDMPRVFLTRNPALGDMHEIDGGYQIACISVHRESFEIGLTLFMPYLWVNTGTAMATGREVLGFQKDVAVSFSANDDQVQSAADLTHIEGWVTPVFGARLQKGFLAQVHPAEANARSAPDHTLERFGACLLEVVEHALPRLAGAINRVLPSHGLIGIDALRRLFSVGSAPSLAVAFIKQFRDSQDGDKACYQRVFSAPARVTHTKLEHLGFGRRVSVPNFASHPIADELGLGPATEPGGAHAAGLTFQVRFQLDMSMQAAARAPRRQRIAILGGGPAALAAMMDLSKFPERFQLTLYQMGWRLGGKCASGRGFSSPLGAEGGASWQRNQEHGLHMALGFYENFFDLLRQAYDNLNRPEGARLRHWTDAVAPRKCFTLEERPWPGFGGWVDLPMALPENSLVPGDRARHADASQGRPDLLDGILGFVESLLHMATRIPLRPLEAVGQRLDLAVLREVLEDLRRRGAAWVHDAGRFVTSLQQELHAQLQPLHQILGVSARPAVDTAHWPFSSELAALEMGLRFVCGIGALLQKGEGFDAIDDIEFSDWLDRTLAFPMLPWTRSSAVLRACYVLPFAYAAGDTRRPLLAAGAGARALLRILADYAGAVAYDFRAGMGECVIAPFYQTIKRRSPDARFEFFSRVRELRVSAGQISEIRIGRQATMRGGAEYCPLTEVDGMDCFPAAPLYDQLEQGAALRQGRELVPGGYDLESSWTQWRDVATETLRLGEHFDLVIVAMPPPALAPLTRDLIAASRPWAMMLEHVTGVPTIAAQLWLRETLDDLGWSNERSGGDGPPLILSYQRPLQAGADMSEVLRHEPWTSREPAPRSVLYLCDAMEAPPGEPAPETPDPEYIRASREAARRQSLDWVQTAAGHLLPGLVDAAGNIRWELFCSPVPAQGEERFAAQYYRGNTSPSERYITTFPGSVRYRLAPGSGVFENLYLAGDWTRNNLEIGSLEGAILSGRMAARAILGGSYALYGERDPMPWGLDAPASAE